MNTPVVYYSSIAICGGLLGVWGLSSVLSGDVAVVPLVLSVGGSGMVLGVVYEAYTSADLSESTPDDRLVWTTFVLALVGVLAGLWSVFG